MKGKFLLLLGFLFKVAIPARDVPLPPSHCGSRHFCPENGARGRTNVPITVPRLTRATAVETNPTISWPYAWAAADSFGDLAGCLQLRGGGELSEQEELEKARQLLEKAVQGFAAAGKSSSAMKDMGLESLSRALEGGRTVDIEKAAETAKRRAKSRLRLDKDGGIVDEGSEDSSEWEREVREGKVREENALRQILNPGHRPWSNQSAWKDLRSERTSLRRDPLYPFWKAVVDNNADRLRYLLGPSDSEVSSNATRHRFAALWNSTLLHVAAEAGDVEILTTLIERGGETDALNCFNQTPLHLACYWGATDLVERLVDMGADIEFRGEDDSTGLHIAAFTGKNETVRILVKLGASLTSVTKENLDAIALASMGGFYELESWLRRAAGRPQSSVSAEEKKERLEVLVAQNAQRINAEYIEKMTSGTEHGGDLSEEVKAQIWKVSLESAQGEARAQLRSELEREEKARPEGDKARG